MSRGTKGAEVHPLPTAIRPVTGTEEDDSSRNGSLDLDTKDHEFRRLHRSKSDEHIKQALFDVELGHGGTVACHKVRLFRLSPLHRPLPPKVQEKRPNLLTELGPQGLSVRFERGPQDTALNARLNEEGQSPNRDILPLAVRRKRAASPHHVPAVHAPQAVDAGRIEQTVLTVAQGTLQPEDIVQRGSTPAETFLTPRAASIRAITPAIAPQATVTRG